jgi:hypothetical protein
LKRISHEPQLQSEWFEDIEGDHPYRIEAVMEYQQKVEQFQEKMLLVIHIVGGQLTASVECTMPIVHFILYKAELGSEKAPRHSAFFEGAWCIY